MLLRLSYLATDLLYQGTPSCLTCSVVFAAPHKSNRYAPGGSYSQVMKFKRDPPMTQEILLNQTGLQEVSLSILVVGRQSLPAW